MARRSAFMLRPGAIFQVDADVLLVRARIEVSRTASSTSGARSMRSRSI